MGGIIGTLSSGSVLNVMQAVLVVDLETEQGPGGSIAAYMEGNSQAIVQNSLLTGWVSSFSQEVGCLVGSSSGQETILVVHSQVCYSGTVGKLCAGGCNLTFVGLTQECTEEMCNYTGYRFVSEIFCISHCSDYLLSENSTQCVHSCPSNAFKQEELGNICMLQSECAFPQALTKYGNSETFKCALCNDY